MTVRVQDIVVGRCYVTSGEQLRRVLEITADRRVRWERPGTLPNILANEVPSLEKFATEVEHEVRCDDPRYYGVSKQVPSAIKSNGRRRS